MALLKLSCKALLKLSYMAPELHGSLATWPSGLSGSLGTKLYGPSGIELQGSLETELHGS